MEALGIHKGRDIHNGILRQIRYSMAFIRDIH